jgi:hypothetical protein
MTLVFWVLALTSLHGAKTQKKDIIVLQNVNEIKSVSEKRKVDNAS